MEPAEYGKKRIRNPNEVFKDVSVKSKYITINNLYFVLTNLFC